MHNAVTMQLQLNKYASYEVEIKTFYKYMKINMYKYFL